RRAGGTAKVDGVAGDERPVAVDDAGHQLPILQACPATPDNMRGFAVTACLGVFRQFRAQAFIDQELHRARWRSGTHSSEMITAPLGSGRRTGRPRTGLADA